jgi:hypothetical protein
MSSQRSDVVVIGQVESIATQQDGGTSQDPMRVVVPCCFRYQIAGICCHVTPSLLSGSRGDIRPRLPVTQVVSDAELQSRRPFSS